MHCCCAMNTRKNRSRDFYEPIDPQNKNMKSNQHSSNYVKFS